MSKLAQQLIAENKAKQARGEDASYLDLGKCGLTEWPDLSGMEWLETLVVSREWWDWEQRDWISSANTGPDNRMKDILTGSLPVSLRVLIACGDFYEGWGISDVRFLENLTGLTTLDLSRNQISNWRFLENLTGLTRLDLSENQISDGRFLEKLMGLVTLNLSSNEIYDVRFLGNLRGLTSLDLGGNRIMDGRFLEKLTNLTTLDLSINQISEWSFLQKLTALTTLDLSTNRISDGRFLEKLTNLTTLDISDNQISDGCFLEKLTNLITLDISDNQISDWSFLEKLTGLTTLNLSGNQISNWRVGGNLTGLTSLDLSDNQISDGSFLEKLTGLTSLDLSDNQISDWTFLEKLTNLTSLHLAYNEISEIHFSEKLTGLTLLFLGYNQISDCSFLEKLTGLTSLDLSNNQIKNVGPVRSLRHLSALYLQLQGNPIQYVPQEIYSMYNCAEALFDYFDALDAGQKVTDRQLKIMFLGNGCTGKTTLLHWFLDNEFKDLSLEQARTHGVIIQPHLFERSGILGNFWDFGGQEIYHATHRLFMGRRSMYILMWAKETPETEEETRHLPQYWLDMIADLTESGERSRILIVQNQFSDEPELDIFESNEQREDYRKQGLDISTYFINAQTGENVDILKMVVEKEAEKQIEANAAELPETWAAIRKKVTELRHAGRKTLPLKEFEDICETEKLTTSKVNLLNYLHSAGELFYYENQFHNQIILDQQWALDAVYAILKKNKIEQYGGIFTVEDLREIWRSTHTNLSEREANVFLNFMLANEIAFRLDNRHLEEDSEQKLVVPQLLGINPPPRRATWNRVPDKLRHRIEYRFLHRSIIERFMAKTGVLSRQYEFWRQGLFINLNNDDEAMIEVCEEEGKKFILIECVGSGRVQVLQKIRKEFHNIRSLDKASEFRFGGREWQPYDEKIVPGEKSGFSERELRYFSEKNEDKTIRIFLASSAELAEDRENLRQFFSEKNDRYRESGSPVYIKLENWEAMSGAMSETRKQDDYNKRILKSDLFICLAHTKVGKYTEEEFDVAWAHLNKTGTPKIFAFFKKDGVDPLKVDPSLRVFHNKLSELKQFPDDYTGYADLKGKIWKELEILLG